MPAYNSILLNSANSLASKATAAVLASALIAVSANITVPMLPVPMTLQTITVILTGLTLGSRWGAIALLLYLCEGVFGLPVFAGGAAGLAKLVGPSGGYLIGFMFTATLAGWLAERWVARSWLKAVLAAVAAGTILYVPGLLWLGACIGFDKPILQLGLAPFIPGDLVKAALAASLYIGGAAILKRKVG